MRKMRIIYSVFGLVVLGCMLLISPSRRAEADQSVGISGGESVFLPLITTPPEFTPQINAPYLPGTFDWNLSAISWFGKVNLTDNYVDVRTAYSGDSLRVKIHVFDKWIYYDPTPTPDTLKEWDAVSIYIDLDGNVGSSPSTNSYLFTSQINKFEPFDDWRAAWQGNGSGWDLSGLSFTTVNDYRGNSPNSGQDSKGWWISFEIPFTSLGLAAPPPDGTTWGIGFQAFDADDAAGTPVQPQAWPRELDPLRPDSWGVLRFGIPEPQTRPAEAATTVEIRHGLNGAVVTDGHVGGRFLCGGGLGLSDFFDGWGDINLAGDHNFNIQNQHDLADWPCFSKAYITFPLNQVPPGKKIVAANLRLYINGNSGQTAPGPIPDSFIQILMSSEPWGETSITWNNAPYAWQNYGGRWVTPMPLVSPPLPWDWDVTAAIQDAYTLGLPARLILYSSDIAPQHTGKYFLASESGGTNEVKRPTLTVEWTDP